jgi:squalene-hopene/tetraprenyl-beta-curcumene cyclase
MKARMRQSCLLSACVAAFVLTGCSRHVSEEQSYDDNATVASPTVQSDPSRAGTWDPKSAAAYLDQRESWWMSWPGAARDNGTFCISCHTTLPYMVARPALRKAAAEDGPSVNERLVLADVTKRVRGWAAGAPYYADKQSNPHAGAQSRATEAVINAFVLANDDALSGTLSKNTLKAFSEMWTLQQTSGRFKGAWLWQQFGLLPWESRGGEFYGATLAAYAAGIAPQNYADTPGIKNNVQPLIEFLQSNASGQPLINRVNLLWASTKLNGVLTAEQKKSIIQDVCARQRTDGGWSMTSVSLTWRDLDFDSLFGNWKREDGTPQETESDGLATGFITYVLQEDGVSRDDARVKRGLEWLAQHQDKTDGSWAAYSLNKRRAPDSVAGRFMTDAATAFAVLALRDSRQVHAENRTSTRSGIATSAESLIATKTKVKKS